METSLYTPQLIAAVYWDLPWGFGQIDHLHTAPLCDYLAPSWKASWVESESDPREQRGSVQYFLSWSQCCIGVVILPIHINEDYYLRAV